MMKRMWAMKDGDEAYFFRASESDCNGNALSRIDKDTPACL
jgi:hypothetical protein